MYLSYLWHSKDIEPSRAYENFARILGEQQAMYSMAWGFPVELNIHQQGNVLVGQLTVNSGVIGWQSWCEGSNSGLAWNGICESFLGTRFSEPEIQSVCKTLSNSSGTIADWDGNFYIISWSKAEGNAYLTTGATDCPTLWQTQGKYGWAAGSRGAPILEMVGHEKQLSAAACNVLMAYGYNYTNQSLLEHVNRVPQRTQVILRPHKDPKLIRYSTIAEFVEPYSHETDRARILTDCSDRLVERIDRQLKYSPNPEVLVTGGRDSRCLAAAAKRAGFNGVVSTGGATDSKDLIVGKQVAQRLGLHHKSTPDRVAMAKFGNATDRLKLWSKMSEGIEVLRHALAYNRFVEGKPPTGNRQQIFHGLGGEISRGYYYKNIKDIESLKTSDYSIGRKILLSAANPLVRLTSDAKDLLESRFDEYSHEFGSNHASVTQWLDMFFWQNSCLRWGSDMLSVKSTMYWIWAPFLDRKLISSYWSLDLEDKRSDNFIQDLTLTLNSELKGLEYDTDRRTSRKPTILSRLISNLKLQGKKPHPATGQEVEIIHFWENILLNTNNPVWSKCLDEKTVQKMIYNKPSSEILWNAATIQLMYESNC